MNFSHAGVVMEWNEGMIARAIGTQILARRCVVLVDNCNWTGHECDVLAVTVDLRIIDVEIKISRSDLRADARKGKWWHQPPWRWNAEKPAAVARQHPPRVWKHYYCMPADIWKPELATCLPSEASGILLVRHQRNAITVSVERRATPSRDAARLRPEQVMDIARLANLRMWGAYRREADARHSVSLAEAEYVRNFFAAWKPSQ